MMKKGKCTVFKQEFKSFISVKRQPETPNCIYTMTTLTHVLVAFIQIYLVFLFICYKYFQVFLIKKYPKHTNTMFSSGVQFISSRTKTPETTIKVETTTIFTHSCFRTLIFLFKGHETSLLLSSRIYKIMDMHTSTQKAWSKVAVNPSLQVHLYDPGAAQ